MTAQSRLYSILFLPSEAAIIKHASKQMILLKMQFTLNYWSLQVCLLQLFLGEYGEFIVSEIPFKQPASFMTSVSNVKNISGLKTQFNIVIDQFQEISNHTVWPV